MPAQAMQDALSPESKVAVPGAMAGSVDRPKQGEMMSQVWDMSRRVQLGTAGDQA